MYRNKTIIISFFLVGEKHSVVILLLMNELRSSLPVKDNSLAIMVTATSPNVSQTIGMKNDFIISKLPMYIIDYSDNKLICHNFG